MRSFAFFYACLHVSSYVGLDQFFDWRALWKDVLKRRYITVGMLALAPLVPLAATSTGAMVRRLGGRRWRALHRTVYLIAPLAVLHFWMMIKADHSRPLLYGAVTAILLGYRAATVTLARPVPPSLSESSPTALIGKDRKGGAVRWR